MLDNLQPNFTTIGNNNHPVHTIKKMSEEVKQPKVIVWLIVNGEKILIKNKIGTHNIALNKNISNVTIIADNINTALDEIESSWGIFQYENSLNKIYSFSELDYYTGAETETDVYSMDIYMNNAEQQILEELADSKLMEISEIKDRLQNNDKAFYYISSNVRALVDHIRPKKFKFMYGV